MTRYERVFGTDWETLGPDSATDRAYAIGVAERLGEDNHDELQAIYDEMDSAYVRSMVELAYREGRTEAREASADDDDTVWSKLVTDEDGATETNAERASRDPPDLLNPDSLLGRANVDSTDAVDRPDFLER